MTRNKKLVIIIICALIAAIWVIGGFLLFKYLNRPKTGTEIAQKSLSQIANDMKGNFKMSIGGDKQVHSLKPTPYIYSEDNPNYVYYLDEDPENCKDTDKMKEKIAAGEYDKKYSYMGLFDDAKLNDRISADMRYSDLSNEIGKFDCGKINEKGEYGYETEVDGQRTYFTFKADKKTKAEVPDGEKVKKKYLEKINPKIHAIIVFPDDTASSDDADKILEDKISELTEEYGVASDEKVSRADIGLESDTSWTKKTGLISAKIIDLDCDGTDELVVARLKGGTLNEESDNLEIEVFFIKDGEAVTAGAEVFYTGDDFTEKRIDSFIYNIKDKNYIFVEADYSKTQSDVTSIVYSALEFDNNKLKKSFALRSESSVGDYYRWIETKWNNDEEVENVIYKSIFSDGGKTTNSGKYKDSEHPEVDYLSDFGLPETDEKFDTNIHYKYFNTESAEQLFEYSIIKTPDSGNFKCECTLTDYTDIEKYDKAEKEDKTEKESEENTDTEYTAQDLMNKPVDEIAELMDNDFEIDEGQIYTMLYFHNYDKFPGMDFYVKSENNDKEAARSGILDGTIEFNAIEVTGSGKGCRYEEQIVTADMDYSQCSEIFGEVDCEPSGGRIGSGALGAVAYNYSEDELTITINFELTDTLTKLIQEEGNSTVSYDTMIEENPNVQNIIVQKKIDGEF